MENDKPGTMDITRFLAAQDKSLKLGGRPTFPPAEEFPSEPGIPIRLHMVLHAPPEAIREAQKFLDDNSYRGPALSVFDLRILWADLMLCAFHADPVGKSDFPDWAVRT